MTAIAYKDGMMAGDQFADLGTFGVYDTKVLKVYGHLLGMAGKNTPANPQLVDWLFPKNIPLNFAKGYVAPLAGKYNFDVVVVTPKGKIYNILRSGTCVEIKGGMYATGSGEGICMGAMMAGASPKEAVEIAIKLNGGCKGKATTVFLD